MSDKVSQVGRMGGPGSQEFSVTISMADFRSRLAEALHPLAQAPQWDGNSTYLVFANDGQVVESRGTPRDMVLVVVGKDEGEAMECALTALKALDRKATWSFSSVQKVNFDARKRVLFCGDYT